MGGEAPLPSTCSLSMSCPVTQAKGHTGPTQEDLLHRTASSCAGYFKGLQLTFKTWNYCLPETGLGAAHILPTSTRVGQACELLFRDEEAENEAG